MNEEFINKKEIAELNALLLHLDKQNIKAHLIEKSTNFSVNVLVVLLSDSVSVNLMYLPVPEEQFSQLRLLQYHSLIWDKEIAQPAELVILLNEMNSKSPMGNYSVNSDGEISFRYLHVHAKTEILEEVLFIESFSVFSSTLKAFSDILKKYLEKSVNMKEALALLGGISG